VEDERRGVAQQTLARAALAGDNENLGRQAAQVLLSAPLDTLTSLARGQVPGVTTLDAARIGQLANLPESRRRLLFSIPSSPAAQALDGPIGERLIQSLEQLQEQGHALAGQFLDLLRAQQLAQSNGYAHRVDQNLLQQRLERMLQEPLIQEAISRAQQATVAEIDPPSRNQLLQQQLAYLQGPDLQVRLALMDPEERYAAVRSELDRVRLLNPEQLESARQALAQGTLDYYSEELGQVVPQAPGEITPDPDLADWASGISVGLGGISSLGSIFQMSPGWVAGLRGLGVVGSVVGGIGAALAADQEFADGDVVGGSLQLGQVAVSAASVVGGAGVLAGASWAPWLVRGSLVAGIALTVALHFLAEEEKETFLRQQGLLLE